MTHRRTSDLVSLQPSGEKTQYPRLRLWFRDKLTLDAREELPSVVTPATSSKRSHPNHDFERHPKAVDVPGERIKRLHLQRWHDMSVRQRNSGLNARAAFKLPAGLKIDEVHASRRQSPIAFGVLFGCSDDIGYEDVLHTKAGISMMYSTRESNLPRGRCASDACAQYPASGASALRRAIASITDLKNLIKDGEDRACFAGEGFHYAASKRHHHQGTLTSNEFMGDGVVGWRIRMSIKLLINICLWSR